MIRIKKKPTFRKTHKYLVKLENFDARAILEKVGRLGVTNLSSGTPFDTGETAQAWSYRITGNRRQYKLRWTNSVLVGQVPLVIILQYGHGTKSGYFVSGRDFINPALKPAYEALHRLLREEVFQ